MGIAPMGFLVTKGSEIQFIATRTSRGLGAAFEKLPDLIVPFKKRVYRAVVEAFRELA